MAEITDADILKSISNAVPDVMPPQLAETLATRLGPESRPGRCADCGQTMDLYGVESWACLCGGTIRADTAAKRKEIDALAFKVDLLKPQNGDIVIYRGPQVLPPDVRRALADTILRICRKEVLVIALQTGDEPEELFLLNEDAMRMLGCVLAESAPEA